MGAKAFRKIIGAHVRITTYHKENNYLNESWMLLQIHTKTALTTVDLNLLHSGPNKYLYFE